MDLKDLQKQIHECSVKTGDWANPDIMGWSTDLVSFLRMLYKEYYTGKPINKVYQEVPTPKGFPVVLAETLLKILDFCAYFQIDIEPAIEMVLKHKQIAADKHDANRPTTWKTR